MAQKYGPLPTVHQYLAVIYCAIVFSKEGFYSIGPWRHRRRRRKSRRKKLDGMIVHRFHRVAVWQKLERRFVRLMLQWRRRWRRRRRDVDAILTRARHVALLVVLRRLGRRHVEQRRDARRTLTISCCVLPKKFLFFVGRHFCDIQLHKCIVMILRCTKSSL